MKKTNKFKAALSCARSEFTVILLDPRVVILPAVLVFIYVFAVEPLQFNARLMEKPLNVFEPYIAALNSGLILLVVPLGFLCVAADFPQVNSASMFKIFRTGRRTWFVGELICLVFISLTYIITIFLSSLLLSARNSAAGDLWSSVILDFKYDFPEYSENFGAQLIPNNLYNQLSISEAVIQSTFFVLAYLILLGLILFAFTVYNKKTLGFVVCCGIIAAGSALCSIRADAMWALPMANSVVWLHYTEFRRIPIYPVWASALYFIVISAALIFLISIRLKKFDCFAAE